MAELTHGLAPREGIDEGALAASLSRLHALVGAGGVSIEQFSNAVEQVFAAASHADLEAAMSKLPPLVRLTPPSQRLAHPLVLRVPDSSLQLGPGWQLAEETDIATGFGTTRLDLTTASWDAQRINLRLQTWGSIDVLVPRGVAVQVVGGSASVRLDSLSAPLPGGPLLRLATAGPAGLIRIGHPSARRRRGFARRIRRRREARAPTRRA